MVKRSDGLQGNKVHRRLFPRDTQSFRVTYKKLLGPPSPVNNIYLLLWITSRDSYLFLSQIGIGDHLTSKSENEGDV